MHLQYTLAQLPACVEGELLRGKLAEAQREKQARVRDAAEQLRRSKEAAAGARCEESGHAKAAEKARLSQEAERGKARQLVAASDVGVEEKVVLTQRLSLMSVCLSIFCTYVCLCACWCMYICTRSFVRHNIFQLHLATAICMSRCICICDCAYTCTCICYACMHAYARRHVCNAQVMLKRLEELIVKGDEARSALGVLEHMPALTKQSAEHKLYETGLMKRRELGQAAAGILDAFVGFGAQVSITLPVPMCVSVYLCVSVHVCLSLYTYIHTYKHNL